MGTFLIIFHVITCIVLVFVVLIQAGKEGGLGAMSGGSQTVFGSSGGANFFTKFTAVTAALFMATSITLTVIKSGKKTSVFDGSESSAPIETTTSPATNAPAGAAPSAPAGETTK
ncbi:MAG TPA: preprotein translocase subunit SecG [Oligoflexia bacterium]|nr:preprotein translocase subunit SecG [Oligoflexia bacterium]